MYSFKDNSDNSLVLRPEGTAGCMRMVLENNLHFNLPLRYFYCGKMFRYERPQEGRLRQFNQIGVQLLGVRDYSADIEVMMSAYQFLRACHINQDQFTLQINFLPKLEQRKLYNQSLLDYFKADNNKQYNELSETSRMRVDRGNAMRIFDSKVSTDLDLLINAPKPNEFLKDEDLQNFNSTQTMLNQLGIKYSVNPFLVRGLDYYNGLVFEFRDQDQNGKSQDTFLAGGRYDGLSKILSDSQIPAIGFATGVQRLINLLNQDLIHKEIKERKPKKLAIIPFMHKSINEETEFFIKQQCFQILRELGNDAQGNLELQLCEATKKIDQSISAIQKKKFDCFVILGQDEIRQRCVQVQLVNSEIGGKYQQVQVEMINQIQSKIENCFT